VAGVAADGEILWRQSATRCLPASEVLRPAPQLPLDRRIAGLGRLAGSFRLPPACSSKTPATGARCRCRPDTRRRGRP